jgi:hypothetical protein
MRLSRRIQFIPGLGVFVRLAKDGHLVCLLP